MPHSDVGSKSQSFSFFDPRQLFHFLEQIFGDGTVHLDECNRGTASKIAAEREGRDIDAGIAQKTSEASNEPRLVLIADIDHRGRYQRVDLDAIDRNDARLAIVKHGPRDGALALLGLD